MSRKQKIDEMNQKLSALKEQKDRLGSEALECVEKRNRLNEQFRDLRAEISKLRAERDEANEKVKWLKQRRTELKAKIYEKVEESKRLNREVKVLAEKEPRRNYQALQKEFEELEWEIQTTALSVQEEKELVERVKQVELQLSVYRKRERLDQEVSKLRSEIKALDAEGKQCHQTLTTIAPKSQETHQKMLAKIEESKKIKAKADDLHKAFLQARERLKPIQEEIDKVFREIKQVKGEIREEEEKQKKHSEEALRDKLEQQAREKLKRGEKLTWEEFQLLAEKGMEAQD